MEVLVDGDFDGMGCCAKWRSTLLQAVIPPQRMSTKLLYDQSEDKQSLMKELEILFFYVTMHFRPYWVS